MFGGNQYQHQYQNQFQYQQIQQPQSSQQSSQQSQQQSSQQPIQQQYLTQQSQLQQPQQQQQQHLNISPQTQQQQQNVQTLPIQFQPAFQQQQQQQQPQIQPQQILNYQTPLQQSPQINQFNYIPSYQSSPIGSTNQTQQYDSHQQHSPQINSTYQPTTLQQSSYQQPYRSTAQVNSFNNMLYNDPNFTIKKTTSYTKEETEIFIEKSFKTKINEWRNWTFYSALFIYLSIILSQLLFTMLLLSPSSFSKNEIIKIGFYLLIQVIICFSHRSLVSVYRQVPASFREFFSKFTIVHLDYIIRNSLQFYLLIYFFSLKDMFKVSFTKDICFEDAAEGYIIKCQSGSNIFSLLTLVLSILLIGSIIFKTFSNQEFVLSFPKANISTILQIKASIYNGFWISFYSSFYFFGIGSILSILLFILYRTFTIKIILYLCHLWCYSFIIIFQNFIRFRIFEIYYTKSLRFSVDKFVESNKTIEEKQTTPVGYTSNNTNSYHICQDNEPIIENPNIFLQKGIEDDDPLVQFLAWKDLLYVSKYSESRRNQLFSEILQMAEHPTILKILSKYEEQIYNLDAIFSTPREFYEPNYKKDDGDNNKDNKDNKESNKTNNKKNRFEINFNFLSTIKKMITQITGIRFEYNAYDSEIKQALSNTQSVLWSIEAIGSLIVSAQLCHDPQVMEHLHRYQIPQKFLAPLFRIISIVEKLENDLQFQIEMDRSTLQEYYLIKSLINQIEPPKNCFGILQTSRPHFRIFKQVGKNTISQVLETIGNQISDISLPYDLRPLLNSYKNGEFSIYQ